MTKVSNRVFCGLVVFAAFVFPGAVRSQTLVEKIDKAIAGNVKDYSKRASSNTTDLEFLRRATLDLHGTIPTAKEARDFLADKNPNKRALAIDRLLKDNWHGLFFAGVLDTTWMERRPNKHVKNEEWKKYLVTSMLENKPYDQLVREILSADGNDDKTRAAARFYLDRDADPHLLTRDISRLFLGSNWQCSQCHDHPRIEDYKQDMYYGLFAFFNRTSVFTDPKTKKAVLAEKADGDVTFQSVFDPKKVTKASLPKMGARKEVTEPKFEKGKEYDMAPTKDQRGVPKFSRRSKLAGELANGEFAPFPRNAANRYWNHLMGRGLVHPLDMDHTNNPPSHPELLNLLAQELVKMKFNQREFLSALAKTQTYQLSSLAKEPGELQPQDYLVGAVRPMSAEQFAYSLMQATGYTDAEAQALGNKGDIQALRITLRDKISPQAQPVIQAFSSQPGEAATYDSRVEQALFLSNNGHLQSLLSPRAGSLTARLTAINSPEQLTEELYLSVLTRLPTALEVKETIEYLKARSSDRASAIRDLIWALVTSVEFRFIS